MSTPVLMSATSRLLRLQSLSFIVPCRHTVRGSTVPPSVTEKQQKAEKVIPLPYKPRDEPAFIEYTPEQREWFWSGLEQQYGKAFPADVPLDKYPLPDLIRKKDPNYQPIDPESEPFRQIYEGNQDDGGNFSGAEAVRDKNVWFWVQRILPNNPVRDLPRTDCRDRMPSGWIPPPITPPPKSFFVRRLRNGLYPVFKQLIHREKVHTKLITDHVFDPHPDVLTLVTEVDGEIRDLEQELVDHLQSIKKKKILSAVSEFEAKITFKGDHVEDIVKWLETNGF